MLKWLYQNWMKATPFLALYGFIFIFLYVKDVNYPLYLIWLQTVVYWFHEFEEYILPGGFLKYFNHHMMRSVKGDYPLTTAGSFWINIPLIYIAMPLSAIFAHYFGIKWGLWCAYFSCFNALAHVVMFFKFNRKYNPGLVVSVLFNIPLGVYTVWYFISNNLVSTNANIISIIVGILAQASMMIYGFCYLVPEMKKKQLKQKRGA